MILVLPVDPYYLLEIDAQLGNIDMSVVLYISIYRVSAFKSVLLYTNCQ